MIYDALFRFLFGFDFDDSNDCDHAPNDLKHEREPSIFRKNSDGHKGCCKKIEQLVREAVFDFAKWK